MGYIFTFWKTDGHKLIDFVGYAPTLNINAYLTCQFFYIWPVGSVALSHVFDLDHDTPPAIINMPCQWQGLAFIDKTFSVYCEEMLAS